MRLDVGNTRRVLLGSAAAWLAAGCGCDSPDGGATDGASDASADAGETSEAGPRYVPCDLLGIGTPGAAGDFDGDGCTDYLAAGVQGAEWLALTPEWSTLVQAWVSRAGPDLGTPTNVPFLGLCFETVLVSHARLEEASSAPALFPGNPAAYHPSMLGGSGYGAVVGLPFVPDAASDPITKRGTVFVMDASALTGYPRGSEDFCGGDLVEDAAGAVRIDGAAAGDTFGAAVAGLGDFDGDGGEDLAVGATHEGPSADGMGEVLVYASPLATLTPVWTAQSVDPAERFGAALAWTGDLDGDGVSDLAVGAPGASGGAGRVYVYRGGAGADAVADLVLDGEAPGDLFGTALAGLGDSDGDGFLDLAVGAPGVDGAGPDVGRVYVYRGGPGLDGVPDAILDGATLGGGVGRFGWSLAGIGDADLDGRGDLVVGAPGPTEMDAGRLFVFLGPFADGTPWASVGPPDVVADVEGTERWVGYSVSGGDLDQDGDADVLGGFAAGPAGGHSCFYVLSEATGPGEPHAAFGFAGTCVGPGARAFFAL